jgi:hypothetical protein
MSIKGFANGGINIMTNLIPMEKKSQILFFYIFVIGCPSEESYEMEFPKGANM